MRRRDVLSLGLLAGVVLVSWQQLKPPPVTEVDQGTDLALLGVFERWHGPVDKVVAAQGKAPLPQTDPVEPAVKGASSEEMAVLTPRSLLPVETYYGSPFSKNLSDILAENKVSLNPEDVVAQFPPNIGYGSVVTVYRATPVKVTDWGKTKLYWSWQPGVAGFLAEQGIELGENDKIAPAVASQLVLAADNGPVKIVITRVAITEVKVEEKIDFKMLQKEDAELPRGQTKVTPGKFGTRVKKFRVTRENGVEVKRELVDNQVTVQPVDQLTVIGTKVLIGKSYTGRASWYKYDNTKVATDLPGLKRGTLLRITNLANGKQIIVKNDGCICADTGYAVDLHPDYFTSLGGVIRDGVIKQVRVEEVLN